MFTKKKRQKHTHFFISSDFQNLFPVKWYSMLKEILILKKTLFYFQSLTYDFILTEKALFLYIRLTVH